MLAEFIQSRRADALQLAAAKRGLDDVRNVERAFRAARADHRVHFVDEEDDVLRLPDLIHHGFDAFLKLAAVFGACDHQSEVQRDHALVAQDLRHVSGGDFLRQAFHDGGFAHTGLADEHGIVFRAAAEDLDHAGDLLGAADDGIELTFDGDLGQIAAKGLQSGRLLAFALLFGRCVAGGHGLLAFVLVFLVLFAGGEVRIELAEDFAARLVEIDLEILQNLRGDTVTFAQEAEEDVLRADVAVIEGLRFLAGEREHLFHTRRVGNVADHLRLRAGADLLLDLQAHGFEIEAEFGEHVHGDALTELDEAEEQMLRAHVVVVDPIRFLAGERQHLLRAWSEVVHHG